MKWEEVTTYEPFHRWFSSLDEPFANAYLDLMPAPNEDPVFVPDLDNESTLRTLASEAVPLYQEMQARTLESLKDFIEDIDPLPLSMGALLVMKVRPWGEGFEPAEPSFSLALELIMGIIAGAQPSSRRPAMAADLDKTIALAVELQFLAEALAIAYAFSSAADAEANGSGHIRYTLISRWLHMRGSAYLAHAEATAKSLASNHSNELYKKLGFSVPDLMQLSSSCRDLWDSQLSPSLDAAWRAASAITGESFDDLQEASNAFRNAWITASMYFMAEYLAVPVDGSKPLLSTDRTDREKALFQEMSLRQGDAPPVKSALFDPPQRSRPFLVLPPPLDIGIPGLATNNVARRAVLVDHYALGSDLHMTVESLMARHFPRWPAFRAHVVDKHAVSLLQQVLPGSRAVTNVYVNGPNGREEVDGVILYEDIVLVIEGKGAPLKLAARRGSVAKLTDQMKELVGEGWRQLERDKEYVTRSQGADFFDRSGNCVLRIDRPIRRCYQILPSIDGLGDAGTALPTLIDLGILPQGARPWIVSLTDLNVVTDVLNRPAEFVGYMDFRSRWSGERRLFVVDEVEMLNLYLYQVDLDLRLHSTIPDARISHIPNQALLDNWYEGQIGWGPVVEKPRIRTTKRLRRFVDDIQRTRPAGWLSTASATLQIPITISKAIDFRERFLATTTRRTGTYIVPFGRYTVIVLDDCEDVRLTTENEPCRSAIEQSEIVVIMQRRGNKLDIKDARFGGAWGNGALN